MLAVSHDSDVVDDSILQKVLWTLVSAHLTHPIRVSSPSHLVSAVLSLIFEHFTQNPPPSSSGWTKPSKCPQIPRCTVTQKPPI